MDSTAQRGGNLYDKYGTKNPVARYLMQGFLAAFDDLVAMVSANSAFDVGCGEGHLTIRLAARGLAVRGCDPDPAVVAEANQRLAAAGHPEACFVSTIAELARSQVGADLVVCCEVLEHVLGPEAALEHLISMSRRYLLLSVPREPIWRALNIVRGAYLNDLGNTPGHVNHWSARNFIHMVAPRTRVVATRRPLPWTMVLCERRAGS
jgi:2-polyprenyl-3-methyl-5-hydroxy-6-metoxy-1,4-benzoquinol methylase